MVGGGITGIAILQALAEGPLRAFLVERSHLAAGASGRNAGFLLAGVAANYADAVRLYGRSLAAEIWSFTLDSHRLLREALLGRDVGYAQRGSITRAASVEESRSLEEAATLLREDGFAAEWLPEAFALLNPADGEIDPARAVATLAEGLEQRIRTETTVTALHPTAGSVLVETTAGECRAAAVVLATNGYTRQLLPGVEIEPVRAQMLATAPDPQVIENRPVYSHWGYRYWRQLSDRRLLAGGYRDHAVAEEVGYEEVTTQRIQSLLEAHLHRLGATAAVSHRWAGIMGFTPDGLPMVGPLGDSSPIHLCAGYSGHGMGFAMLAARRIGDHLTSGLALPGWSAPARFPAARVPTKGR